MIWVLKLVTTTSKVFLKEVGKSTHGYSPHQLGGPGSRKFLRRLQSCVKVNIFPYFEAKYYGKIYLLGKYYNENRSVCVDGGTSDSVKRASDWERGSPSP